MEHTLHRPAVGPRELAIRSFRSFVAAACCAAGLLAATAFASPASALAVSQESPPPGISRDDLILRVAGLTREQLSSDDVIAATATTVFEDAASEILTDEERLWARAFLTVVGYRELPSTPPDTRAITLFCGAMVNLSDEQLHFVERSVVESAVDSQLDYGARVREAYLISLRHDAHIAGIGELPAGFPPREKAFALAIEATQAAADGIATAVLQASGVLAEEQLRDMELASEALRQFSLLRSIRTVVPAASLDPVAAFASIATETSGLPSGSIPAEIKPLLREIIESRKPIIDRLISATAKRHQASIPAMDAGRAGLLVSDSQVEARKQALARTARVELDLAQNAIRSLEGLAADSGSPFREQLLGALDTALSDLAAVAPTPITEIISVIQTKHATDVDPEVLAAFDGLAMVAAANGRLLRDAYLKFFADYRSTMTLSPAASEEAARSLSSLAANWNRSTLEALAYLKRAICDDETGAIDACAEIEGLRRSAADDTSRLAYLASTSSAPWVSRLRRR